MKTISAHFLVKNESKFIWYSIMSVIKFVDKLIIYDSGSSDGTREIIKEILKNKEYEDKITYREFENEFNEQDLRQMMLDETKTDWFIVVDGDEIWWEDSIKKFTNLIQDQGDELESIIVPVVLPVGDVFHFQEKTAGRYKFGNSLGHFALRAVNTKIDGLSSSKPHGQWGWTDRTGKMIQDRDSKKIGFLDTPYLHVTHLQRAGIRSKDLDVHKRKMKLKHEIGHAFPLDFYYPEVFFRTRPDIVQSPWQKMNFSFWVLSLIQTPLRWVKRRLFKGKVGY